MPLNVLGTGPAASRRCDRLPRPRKHPPWPSCAHSVPHQVPHQVSPHLGGCLHHPCYPGPEVQWGVLAMRCFRIWRVALWSCLVNLNNSPRDAADVINFGKTNSFAEDLARCVATECDIAIPEDAFDSDDIKPVGSGAQGLFVSLAFVCVALVVQVEYL